MRSGSSEEGLVDDLVTNLLEKDYLEVHGVLKSVGAERLPAGWRDFSPVSKRRTLRKIVGGLPGEQVDELARDYIDGNNADVRLAPAPSTGRHAPAWRPPYAAPADPAEKYGLEKTTATNSVDGGTVQPTQAGPDETESADSIFVVHGRDTKIESQTLLLVERTTGRPAIVLHEQVTGGRTVIEQIERHGSSAGYAIILLTGDDEGGLRGGEMKLRARQNVVLELGYFWGVLGRNRVAVLVEAGVELPSDAGGIHYIDIDSGGGWKAKLLRELDHAGFEIDWNKLRP